MSRGSVFCLFVAVFVLLLMCVVVYFLLQVRSDRLKGRGGMPWAEWHQEVERQLTTYYRAPSDPIEEQPDDKDGSETPSGKKRYDFD